MDGGRTNSIWRITGRAGDFVCKLYQSQNDNPLFPNDPKAEVLALQALEGHKIAPALHSVFQTRLGTCVIYSYEEGSVWSGDTAPVALLLRRLHAMAPPATLRSIPSGSGALWNASRDIAGMCSDVPPELLQVPQSPPVPACENPSFLHGDAVAGNILIGAGGARLIDWQCPAAGDPCEDIAVFLSPAMQHLYGENQLSNGEVAAFLNAYGDEKTAARFKALQPFFYMRMAAYCLWKAQRGQADYLHAMQLELAALKGL